MALTVALGGSVSAQCPPPSGDSADSIWVTPGLAIGTPSQAAIDSYRTDRPGGGSVSYVTSGDTVYAICNVSPGGGGTPCTPGQFVWTRSFTGTNVQNFPNPAPLRGCFSAGSCTYGLFVAEQDGFVRGLNADTGADLPSWESGFDTRRGGCSADEIIATPAVQLKDLSNGAFPWTEDLVIVITNAKCGSTTQNRVMAIGAQSASLKWLFNPSAIGLAMDFGSEGGSIDYDNNRIYFGTNHPGSAGPYRTLWAISTVTGSQVWSKNVGAIRNRPMTRGTHLYAVTFPGSLRVFSSATGADLYTVALTGGGSTVARNFWPEFRGSYAHSLFVVDSAGFLHSIVETDYGPGTDSPCSLTGPTGVCGASTWTPVNLGGVVNSAPAISYELGKGYVGLTSGAFHQVNLATGASEARGVLSGTVYDPTLDSEGGSTIDRIVAPARMGVGNPTVKRFCAPWTPGDIGTFISEPGPLNHPSCQFPPPSPTMCSAADQSHCACWDERFTGTTSCHHGTCDFATNICTSQPQNDMVLCDRNLPELSQTRCRDGVCSLGRVVADTCTFLSINAPDRHCAAMAGQNRMCCQNGSVAEGVCVNILANPNHCGACKSSCGAGQTCCNGVCVDLSTDRDNCRTCGQRCGAGQNCCNGICQPNCDYCCQGVCRAMSAANCGGCDVQCIAPEGCCGGICSDMQFDIANCGACGNVCSGQTSLCFGGQCWCGQPGIPPCSAGRTCCGTVGCKNLQTDPQNCGNCNYQCPAVTPNCVNGTCQ